MREHVRQHQTEAESEAQNTDNHGHFCLPTFPIHQAPDVAATSVGSSNFPCHAPSLACSMQYADGPSELPAATKGKCADSSPRSASNLTAVFPIGLMSFTSMEREVRAADGCRGNVRRLVNREGRQAEIAMIIGVLGLGLCFGLVLARMFTHGRRGRRWGRLSGTEVEGLNGSPSWRMGCLPLYGSGGLEVGTANGICRRIPHHERLGKRMKDQSGLKSDHLHSHAWSRRTTPIPRGRK